MCENVWIQTLYSCILDELCLLIRMKLKCYVVVKAFLQAWHSVNLSSFKPRVSDVTYSIHMLFRSILLDSYLWVGDVQLCDMSYCLSLSLCLSHTAVLHWSICKDVSRCYNSRSLCNVSKNFFLVLLVHLETHHRKGVQSWTGYLHGKVAVVAEVPVLSPCVFNQLPIKLEFQEYFIFIQQ